MMSFTREYLKSNTLSWYRLPMICIIETTDDGKDLTFISLHGTSLYWLMLHYRHSLFPDQITRKVRDNTKEIFSNDHELHMSI